VSARQLCNRQSCGQVCCSSAGWVMVSGFSGATICHKHLQHVITIWHDAEGPVSTAVRCMYWIATGACFRVWRLSRVDVFVACVFLLGCFDLAAQLSAACTPRTAISCLYVKIKLLCPYQCMRTLGVHWCTSIHSTGLTAAVCVHSTTGSNRPHCLLVIVH
jgi:hypothetical protein